jgi:hypothetical protein
MFPEPLESRIAPAAIFTYTDVDGDAVTVKLAIGSQAELIGALTFSSLSDVPRQLRLINLQGLDSPLQSLTVTARPQNGVGDGFANVGAITTSAAAYGSIVIDGDLGRIAGDATSVGKVVAHSLGALGTSTQAVGGANTVGIVKLGTLDVKGDICAQVVIDDTLGVLRVGGSILGLGGNAGGIGTVSVTNRLQSVIVKGALIGGAGTSSGSILADSFGFITVGTMRGGSGDFSGGIHAEDGSIDRLLVRGDVLGGTAANSAQQITAGGKVSVLRIDGSVVGSSGAYKSDPGEFGQIYAELGFGSIVIRNDLVGGSTEFGGSIVSGRDDGATNALDISGNAPITRVLIRGSIVGGVANGTGSIFCDTIGKIQVLGSIRGGIGDRSASLDLGEDAIGSVLVGGDILGGDGEDSATIVGGNEDGLGAPRLLVRGDIVGGFGPGSGVIDSNEGGFATLVIGGQIIGGGGPDSGGVIVDIDSDFETRRVVLGGGIRGGTGADSGFADVDGATNLTVIGSIIFGSGPRSGYLEIDDVIRTLVRGSLFGGLNNAGHIHGDDDCGTLTIEGSIIGVQGTARIIAKGDSFGGFSPFNPVAFTRIAIGGDVRNAEILAGYDIDASGVIVAVTPDVQIGSVNVGGNWIQSNLILGAEDGVDNRFGTTDDASIVPEAPVIDNPDTISRVGSIIIKGSILGIPGGVPRFGFVAEEIGAFRYGKNTLTLTPGTLDPAVSVAPTGDVFVREIP